MLDNFVNSVLCSPADNERITRAKDGDCIFADITEPDVGQVARAQAVNAFKRVSTNNDIGDGRAILEDENSILAASIVIRVAWVATVELLVAKILVSSDDARLGQCDDVARSGRDIQSVRSRHVGDER